MNSSYKRHKHLLYYDKIPHI